MSETDLGLHKSSRFQQHQYLKGETGAMPALTGPALSTVPDVPHVDKVDIDFDGNLPMTTIPPWEDLEISALSQGSYNYHIGSEYGNSNYQSTSGLVQGKAMVSSLWDDNFPRDSTLAYSPSPSTCPRSHSQDIQAFRHAMDDNRYSAWPYLLDATNDQSFPTIKRCRESQNNLLLIPNSSTSRSLLSDESFQNCTPATSPSPLPSKRSNLRSAISPDVPEGYEGANGLATANGDETDPEGGVISEPYAQLIYRALKSAPEHKMVLKEIYEWFEKNTDKATDPSSKGWQNSIRHNLSMNGAFRKVDQPPPTDEAKKGYIWVLDRSALEGGVKSTTRFRKNVPNKKVGKSEHPAPQRQRSGAKGGKAAKKAAKLRRSARFNESKGLPYVDRAAVDAKPAFNTRNSGLSAADTVPYHSSGWPYSIPTPNTTTHSPDLYETSYGYEQIVGCADGLPSEPLFYNAPGHSFCDSIDSSDCCGFSC
ncbi:Winged helix-turn-helix DNA-binding domain [Lasallia pustulata]|uniref:Winged helix-turn-helix DNA-binding domain n=1 Tax=Lasallia pustulata TaxID=136370 RepID=A0A1W5D3M2_9LECA|nr:Winged helix-turn-helix DNA-binding domain [Lasallia pustulata]